jgi:hypothetical protein
MYRNSKDQNTRHNKGLFIQLHRDSNYIYKYLRIPLAWALGAHIYNRSYMKTVIGGLWFEFRRAHSL